MRFTNWLHNGEGSGDTENGVYEISEGLSETRSTNAKYWIPSQDEWYKAAYHKNDGATGNYWSSPTGTDDTPNNNLPTSDTGNSANFANPGYTTGSFSYPLTDVGAYALSGSPYGTFDQGGNVWEWNESLVSLSFRGQRGGAWSFNNFDLSGTYDGVFPTHESNSVGFRVASIPEPATAWLVCIGIAGGLVWRRRVNSIS
jgi:formylglycine-generating enzyme required for sulfatase activity